ncbi:MAG: T9SS type A sorting domain-containing protein [Bacteroidetes bacterium]|nr:T9SS type A sorting domain-containing protein [Bacteroidota bacterium]MBU2636948.1 T9SS type A sorting domain-containing protein [Bacteroidota bacterium]
MNNKWDAGEAIVILTPPPYATSATSTHCQINSTLPSGTQPILPNEGDSIFVFTNRPLTNEDIFEFTTQRSNFIVDVRESSFTPDDFKLYQNYPNPFNSTTTILFSIPSRELVTLKLYDILGREVKTLLNEEKDKGNHKTSFTASDLASGIYFYQLKAGNKKSAKKMILLR